MENVNYTKFSEEAKVVAPEVEEPVIKEEEIVDEPKIEEEEIVEEPKIEEEEIEEPEVFVGVVDNCTSLRVRKEPNAYAAVLKIINVGTKVDVIDEPTDDFYKVQVAGFTGFCMKEYITIE